MLEQSFWRAKIFYSQQKKNKKKMATKQKLKYKSDFDKTVVLNNFEKRGWIKTADGKQK